MKRLPASEPKACRSERLVTTVSIVRIGMLWAPMQASASFLQFFRIPATGFDSSLTERNGQAGERDRRDFRRMTGRVQLMGERVIPGPYTKEWRERWVRRG